MILSSIGELELRFKHYTPNDVQIEHYEGLREIGKDLAYEIEARVPECRERSIAFTKLEEAIMWANAGIARRSE